MKITTETRADVLIQALPYIQKYYNKTIVVKYGGNAMLKPELIDSVMQDIVLLSLIGIRVVLVHGGGPEINDLLTKVGKQSEFIDGLRVTDSETMDCVQMVLAGKLNKNLVKLIQTKGGKAVGLCGIDGNMIIADKLDSVHGFVGNIKDVNPELIVNALDNGFIPVVSTIASDSNGNSYNINADTAASRIAGALKAESLILMTDIRGLLRNKDDESTLIHTVYASDINELTKEGIIKGGMIPKVECATDAIRRGVGRSFIIDGRVPHAILIEVLSDEGLGTMFKLR